VGLPEHPHLRQEGGSGFAHAAGPEAIPLRLVEMYSSALGEAVAWQLCTGSSTAPPPPARARARAWAGEGVNGEETPAEHL